MVAAAATVSAALTAAHRRCYRRHRWPLPRHRKPNALAVALAATLVTLASTSIAK